MHVLTLVAIAVAGIWSVEFTVCVVLFAPVVVKARSDRALSPQTSPTFSAPAEDGNGATELGVRAPLTAS